MSDSELVEKFASVIEIVPVPGSPDLEMIHMKIPESELTEASTMTEADWDKFEADVMAARERSL